MQPFFSPSVPNHIIFPPTTLKLVFEKDPCKNACGHNTEHVVIKLFNFLSFLEIVTLLRNCRLCLIGALLNIDLDHPFRNIPILVLH